MSKKTAKTERQDERHPNHDRFNGATRDLYEATGHYGPWTIHDFVAAGLIEYPKKDPEPDKPDGLLALEAAAIKALVEYNAAHTSWSKAERAAIDLAAKRKTSTRSLRQAHNADLAAANARHERHATEQRLQEAKATLAEADRRWRRTWQADRRLEDKTSMNGSS